MTDHDEATPQSSHSSSQKRLQRRLRQAGFLISFGLLVQAATLYWSHPTAFLVCVGVGTLSVAVGIGHYLLALVTDRRTVP